DNATGDLAAKRAIVQSSQANVRRLEELKSFQKVYAPFSGVVTQRNVDIGTLINAGNGGTSQQLFYLAQTDPIRLYVNVPEAYAPSIHRGLGTYIELAQYPGQKFQGEVVRTAEAIDLATRTLLTEVDVPNKSGLLLPGGYAQVHLQMHVQGERLQVPVNALLFRSEGLRAVVIDANHRVRLQALAIGRDYGTSLEVLTGLKPDDWIVLNPPDSIGSPVSRGQAGEQPRSSAGKTNCHAGKKSLMSVPSFFANHRKTILCGLAGVLFCAGCTVGPNYKRPAAPVPATWQVTEPWRQAEPKDAVPKTAWWTLFHDDELNGLETDLLAANQTLKVSFAHLAQARASAAVQNA